MQRVSHASADSAAAYISAARQDERRAQRRNQDEREREAVKAAEKTALGEIDVSR